MAQVASQAAEAKSASSAAEVERLTARAYPPTGRSGVAYDEHEGSLQRSNHCARVRMGRGNASATVPEHHRSH